MKNGVNQVNFALYYKSRVKATCELPEEKRPKPLTTASQALLNEASLAVTNLDPDIPSQSHKIKLATHILAGAGLLDSVDLILAQVVHLPTTRKGALIIAVPELKKFALPGPFGGKTSHTRALIHGTSVTAAQCILLEGFIRPADWTYNQDLKHSQFPKFRAYALGTEVARSDTSLPLYAALDLMDRASKKGKGQLPVLIGALYRSKHAHLSLNAGGIDLAQLKIPSVGVVTTSEKHTLTHSRNTGVCFFAVTWDQLPGVPVGTYDQEPVSLSCLTSHKLAVRPLSSTGNLCLIFWTTNFVQVDAALLPQSVILL
jgi:hypothetical protein